MLRFGYNVGLPDGVKAAWGCRAIADAHGNVDVVWDRVDAFGDDEAKEALLTHLRDVAGTEPFDNASALLKTYAITGREAREVVLYEDDTVIVKGNTNASHGYLYACAYRKADVPSESCPVCGQPDNCGDCNHAAVKVEGDTVVDGHHRLAAARALGAESIPVDRGDA